MASPLLLHIAWKRLLDGRLLLCWWHMYCRLSCHTFGQIFLCWPALWPLLDYLRSLLLLCKRGKRCFGRLSHLVHIFRLRYFLFCKPLRSFGRFQRFGQRRCTLCSHFGRTPARFESCRMGRLGRVELLFSYRLGLLASLRFGQIGCETRSIR